MAHQEEYSLPSDYGRLEAVFYYGSQSIILTPISVSQRNPRRTEGTPSCFYVWGLNVSGANTYAIGLNDIPSTSGTDDIEIFYRQLPLTMVTGGQAPEIPIQWQDALPAYAAWKTMQRRGREWAGMAREYQMEWQDWVNKAKKYVNPLQTGFPYRTNDTAGYMYGASE